jgi:hypothetical protein
MFFLPFSTEISLTMNNDEAKMYFAETNLHHSRIDYYATNWAYHVIELSISNLFIPGEK